MARSGKVALITDGVKSLGAQSAPQLTGVGANLALRYHSTSDKNDAINLQASMRTKSFR